MAMKGGFSRSWRATGMGESLLTVLVVAGLVGALTYAATRPAARVRIDLTRGADYTLSEQTRSILGALEDPVEFISVMRAETPIIPNGLDLVQAEAADYVTTLLGQYALASGGKVSVRILQPHRDRVETGALLREQNLARYNVVFARGPTRTVQVYLEEMVTIDRGMADAQRFAPASLRELHAEAPLTSALLTVAAETSPKVAFLKGFGGPRSDGAAGVDVGQFAAAVRGQGLEVGSLDLAGGGDVPDEVAVVAVCGPLRSLGRPAMQALKRFHEGGGGLLLAIDPEYESKPVDELLRAVGLVRERSIIARMAGGDPTPLRGRLLLRRFNDGHTVSSSIARQGTFALMEGAGGLQRASGAPAGLVTHPLATTDPEVFGDLPIGPGQLGNWIQDEGEQGGARHVAFAVEPRGAGRVIAFGNSRFLINDFLSQEAGPANLDLGLNAVNWLVGREEAIDVRPRAVYENRIDLLKGELATIALYVLGVMPLAGALLGVMVWLVRRR